MLRPRALPALLAIGLGLPVPPAASQEVALTDVSLVPLDTDRVM